MARLSGLRWHGNGTEKLLGAVTAEPPRCRGIKSDGTACDVIAQLSEEGFCLWHDARRAPQAQAAREKGGATTAARTRVTKTVRADELPGAAPQSLDDVVQWAAWTAHAVACGKIDARTSREISYALQTLRFGLAEQREVKRRLATLERLAKTFEQQDRSA